MGRKKIRADGGRLDLVTQKQGRKWKGRAGLLATADKKQRDGDAGGPVWEMEKKRGSWLGQLGDCLQPGWFWGPSYPAGDRPGADAAVLTHTLTHRAHGPRTPRQPGSTRAAFRYQIRPARPFQKGSRVQCLVPRRERMREPVVHWPRNECRRRNSSSSSRQASGLVYPLGDSERALRGAFFFFHVATGGSGGRGRKGSRPQHERGVQASRGP